MLKINCYDDKIIILYLLGEIKLEKSYQKDSVKVYIALFSILVVSILGVLMIYADFNKKENSFESSKKIEDAYANQTVYAKNAELISQNVIDNISKLNGMISSSNHSSQIYKINQGSGREWVNLSDRTTDILNMSVDVARRSNGAFDPTLLPLTRLWGFSDSSNRVPSISEIQDALSYVSYENLKINNDLKRAKLTKEGAGIDLSFIQKGALCDMAIDTYKNMGADGAIIAIDNVIGTYGAKPNKTPWRIAIRDPFKGVDESESCAILKVNSGCLSTCGPYERNFEENLKTYHYILNSKTGYPTESNLACVSVYHESAALSNMLSMACYVMGIEKSSYLLDYYGAGAVFIDINKDIFVTHNIKKNLIITNDEFVIVDDRI